MNQQNNLITTGHFTKIVPELSRQRRWQLKKMQMGLCPNCGKRKEPDRANKRRCLSCEKSTNQKHGETYGNSPINPDFVGGRAGGPGWNDGRCAIKLA